MSLSNFLAIAWHDTKNHKCPQDGVAFNLEPVGN